jgi:hypothetical protein
MEKHVVKLMMFYCKTLLTAYIYKTTISTIDIWNMLDLRSEALP